MARKKQRPRTLQVISDAHIDYLRDLITDDLLDTELAVEETRMLDGVLGRLAIAEVMPVKTLKLTPFAIRFMTELIEDDLALSNLGDVEQGAALDLLDNLVAIGGQPA